jgi:hypothetical protein
MRFNSSTKALELFTLATKQARCKNYVMVLGALVLMTADEEM